MIDKSSSRVTRAHCITLIPGDGIGPEVTEATVRLLEAAGLSIEWERCVAGEAVFKSGDATGVPKGTRESIERTGIVLKGPLATPVGHGEKSANVTLRTLFELYANIRPARELPGVSTPFGGHRVDLVVVRENVEDLYAGIEHMQTPGVAQCLKLMSRKGCEKITRLAFELARAEHRSRVHCATKANIMKLTEGLLKRTFEEVAREYPDITAEHIIIDNCAHQLVRFPEQFEVIVTSNMNGDILSDLTSGLAGGLGFAPSANIGKHVRMFEAVHGSAPNIAGRGIANPTAMMLSAVMMLRHIGEFESASKIEHALLVTFEEGKSVTVDVRAEIAASTDQFTEAVIGNLGRTSSRWHVHEYRPINLPQVSEEPALVKPKLRRYVGADIFIESSRSAHELGKSLDKLDAEAAMKLQFISNRGMAVYPVASALTDCVDHWRCRFIMRQPGGDMKDADLIDLLHRITPHHNWVHIEKLSEFDGQRGFSGASGV